MLPARGVALLALALLTGCLEEERAITLEPDGTGTLRLTRTLGAERSGAVLDGAPDPEAAVRDSAARSLARFGGVAAWTDVVATVTSDRRVRVTGTAWFEDVTRLVVRGGGLLVDDSPVVVAVLEGDRLLVSLPEEVPPQGELPQGGDDAAALERLRASIAGLRLETTVTVPGEVSACSGWRQDGRSLAWRLDERGVRAALDGLPAGPAATSELARRLREVAQAQATVSVRPATATPGFAAALVAAKASWAASPWREPVERAAAELATAAETGGDDEPARPASPPDRCEPNDERAKAFALGAGTHVGLVAEALQDDWYALAIPPGHELRVTVGVGPDETVQAKLVGEDRRTIATSLIGLGADTLRAVSGAAEAKVFLCVSLGDESPYTLAVELSPWTAGDAFEPNDDEARAAHLPPGPHRDLASDGSDWYRLDVPAGRLADLRVRRGAGKPGRLLVTAVDGGGERLQALLDPRTPLAHARLLAPAGGLRLHVSGDAGVPYAIELGVLDAPQDALGPNDAPERARALAPGRTEATLCGPDWYRVELPAGKQLRAIAASADGELLGDPQLSLHAQDARATSLARAAVPRRGLTIARRAPGPQLLRVDGGAVVPYTLDLALEDYAPEDAAEPNDVAADAGPLAAGRTADLKAGTPDWYALEVPAGAQLTLSAAGGPELSLQVSLHLSTGAPQLVESGVTEDGKLTLSLASDPRPRRVLVHVAPLMLMRDTPLAYTLEAKVH